MLKILRLLRQDAKSWWYHMQCREYGKVSLANELERDSIRRNVQRFRAVLTNEGCLVIHSPGGWSLYEYDNATGRATLEGYGGLKDTLPQVALTLGILVIDGEGCNPTDMLRLPSVMLRDSRYADEGNRYGGNYAFPAQVADLAEKFGAKVYNRKVT